MSMTVRSSDRNGGASLVDVLDRVLDKGLVVAGDIRVALADVELLTIRIRLMICSIDKAQQVGLDWWRHDPHFAPAGNKLLGGDAALRKQVAALQRQIAKLEKAATSTRRTRSSSPKTSKRKKTRHAD